MGIGTRNILTGAEPVQLIGPGTLGESEEALARAFVALHGDNWLHDYKTGRDLMWDGARWRVDHANRMLHDLGEHLRGVGGKPALASARTARGVQQFVRANPAIAAPHEQFDADQMLLGTPQVVVDLKTGRARAAERADYITKSTSVSPEWREPKLWLRFLAEATGGDVALLAYLQRVAGYCLTASIREHALFFLFGAGKNGKSVFLNTITRIAGDYALTAAMETFTVSKSSRHETELARLDGPRLVVASETEEGRAWAESRIKQLTGGDQISARFMRQDYFDFRPVFKLLIAGNFQPQLHNVDEAMRRRFHMIPFAHTPASPDPRLEEKLAIEHPRILAWMIKGAALWASRGLARPDAVVDASDRYFDEQDLFGHWLTERCLQRSSAVGRASELFASWRAFARQNGEESGTQKAMAGALRKRGFQSVRQSGGTRAWQGIEVISVFDEAIGRSDA